MTEKERRSIIGTVNQTSICGNRMSSLAWRDAALWTIYMHGVEGRYVPDPEQDIIPSPAEFQPTDPLEHPRRALWKLRDVWTSDRAMLMHA